VDLLSPQYGLFPFDPHSFTYLVTSFKLAQRSLNSNSVELREDVQAFLRNAEDCHPQVVDDPDYRSLQKWLDAHPASAEGQSPPISEAVAISDEETTTPEMSAREEIPPISEAVAISDGETTTSEMSAREEIPPISEAVAISDGETTTSEMSAKGEIPPTSEALGEKIKRVFNQIRSQYFDDADYKKQVTYPAFLHQGSLISNFPSAKQAVIPQAIRDDWEEATNCLAYGQYRAGSVMAFRSVEGMLRYYYWNVTGSKAEDEVEIIIAGVKEKQIKKWGWEKVVSTLKQKMIPRLALQ